ncbi:CCR4-NOT transcription complex subunit 4 [Babesia microti strain RI]|uniref:CCR4-NOT transcription complex subunit 4 n=1 Tax=Babesia microti (strain RI) TaxID=1133968 RepID=I7I8N0_BABMR|nr:CCR4-NOT transcription complex subunit 4 [Babesia microti strain RI]CCF73378.1 CCR4-NOT transcription complex subunit 4 [Babesia microti strain RI]|eukprot:XP_012647987.1 CCR4-NOT transcription complex subunit 4 [Babesia microti strain RI]
MSDTEDEQLCPLCMEGLDETDRSFSPCGCGYQVCLWCLHYLRTSMGDKCPACRRPYDESKFQFTGQLPTLNATTSSSSNRNKKSKEDISRSNSTTSQSQLHSSQLQNGTASTASLDDLKNMRVLQRNLVYVVGLPQRLAKKEVLKRPEYFGQYGKIQNVVVNRSQAYSTHWEGPSYSVYVTYSKISEASAAIEGIDGSQVDNRILRASFGTTKYCVYFLKNVKCTNVDCFYLHQLGDEKDTFSREAMIPARHQLHGLAHQKADISENNTIGTPNKIFGVINPQIKHNSTNVVCDNLVSNEGDIFDLNGIDVSLDMLISFYNKGNEFLIVTDVTNDLLKSFKSKYQYSVTNGIEEDVNAVIRGIGYKWSLKKIGNIHANNESTKKCSSKLDLDLDRLKVQCEQTRSQIVNHLHQLYQS